MATVMLSLTLTAMVAAKLEKVAAREDNIRFEREADRMLEMLDRRFRMGLQELGRLKDLFAQMDHVPVNLWGTFVGAWDLNLRPTGVIELGYAERVFVPDGPDWTGLVRDQPLFKVPYLEPGLEEHLSRMRRQHGPDYEIRPAAAASELRFPVTHYSAFGGQTRRTNHVAGFDLYTLADHRPALSRAIGLQDTACTGRLLDWGDGQGRVFRLFIPVYRLDMPFIPNSPLRPWDRWQNAVEKRDLLKVVHRERYLKGVLFVTVDMPTLIRTMLDPQNQEIGFRLYAGRAGDAEHLLYGQPVPGPRQPYLTLQRELRPFGQSWFFDFQTLPAFDVRSLRYWPTMTWAAGGILTVLVTGFVLQQIRGRLKEERNALDLRQSHATLQQSEHQLRQALEQRQRISRDLHDIVIQSIYAVGLGLQNCRKLLDKNPERARERLTENMAELNSVIGQLRQFMATLGPQLIEAGTFTEAVEGLVRTLERAEAAAISLRMEQGAADNLTPEQAVEALNIVREAVTNSLRHGRAERIQIIVSRCGRSVLVEVEDDGRGFEPSAPADSGHGLRNMASRAQDVGAQFEIVSKQGGPTRVRVVIPMANHSRGKASEV